MFCHTEWMILNEVALFQIKTYRSIYAVMISMCVQSKPYIWILACDWLLAECLESLCQLTAKRPSIMHR